jgi:tripartite-type tricarboxylate transporter receptor subunit TctC
MMPSAAALAQAFPTKPIRLIVGFAAGGPTDVIARVLAQHMTSSMGQSVVVENRAGANAIIATELVARAAPDGYTTLFSSLSLLVLISRPCRRQPKQVTPASSNAHRGSACWRPPERPPRS